MRQQLSDIDAEVMMAKLHMRGSGSDHSTVDWWRLVGGYKLKSKALIHEERRGYQGIFLGICPSTGQCILHCFERNTIKIARTIRAVPDQVKWNAENIEAVRVSPFDCHKSAEPGVIVQDGLVREGDTDQLKDRPTGR